MIICVEEAPIEEKSIIRNLLQLYIHDFSEFEGFDLNQHGLYGYRYLDHYWTDPDRFPFIVRVNNELAGFALVSKFDRGEYRETRFSEFFIVRKYRRRGVGQDVARQVFARFPGPWVLTERASNVGAQQFWREILGRLVKGEFTEYVETGIRPGRSGVRRQAAICAVERMTASEGGYVASHIMRLRTMHLTEANHLRPCHTRIVLAN